LASPEFSGPMGLRWARFEARLGRDRSGHRVGPTLVEMEQVVSHPEGRQLVADEDRRTRSDNVTLCLGTAFGCDEFHHLRG
jgi:hypothetical protein